MRILSLVLSVLALSAPAAYADHASGNAREIARLSYQLADTAEALEVETERDAGGFPGHGPGPFSLTASDARPEDHRTDNLWQLHQTARSLHLAASDLYRAAMRSGLAPGNTPEDHRGDDIRGSYERVRQEFQNVQSVYQYLRGQCDYRVDRLVQDVLRAYDQLEWCVYGQPRV